MPGDRITLATVPDQATAELLREVLHDGGVDHVEVQTAAGNPYLGRSQALDYQIRVDDVDEARARLVLRDFEADSAQAAASQSTATSEDVEPTATGPLRERKPWVLWGLAALALARRLFHELLER